MRIKRYEGQYVHEVIERIREELGTDAVVLHTRWQNANGLKRLLGKPQVEVWAGAREDVAALGGDGDHAARAEAIRLAIDSGARLDQLDDVEPARPATESAPEALPLPAARLDPAAVAELLATGGHGTGGHATNGYANGHTNGHEPNGFAPNGLATLLAEPEVELPAEPALPPQVGRTEDLTVALLAEFHESLARLEDKVDAIAAAPPAAKVVEPEDDDSPRLRALIESGVDPQVAAEVVAAAEGRTVAEVLLDTFQVTRDVDWSTGPKVIAVVGPSGVGKTTTIAKLAGYYGLQRGARVMLATTDTQRIGTFEQIKALGQLMELPTCSLRSAAEAQAKLQMARQAHDLILVDTAACTPHSGAEWDQLLDILIAIEPDEIHVVVSASMKTRDAARAVGYFQQVLPVNGAVVTKLDEASDPGLLVDLAWRCLIPLSYLGTGHTIPGDLEPARPEGLLQRVWSPRLTAEEA